MPRLISYNKEVRSIFELLGDKENDITHSMSGALAKCPEFLKAVVLLWSGCSISGRNRNSESAVYGRHWDHGH